MKFWITAVTVSSVWGVGAAATTQTQGVSSLGAFLIGAISFIGAMLMSAGRGGKEWGKMESRFDTLEMRLATVDKAQDKQNELLDEIRAELQELALAVKELQTQQQWKPRQRRRTEDLD